MDKFQSKEKMLKNRWDRTNLLLFKNYNELIKKHSDLKIELNNKENAIKNLEEQISSLNIYIFYSFNEIST